MARYRLLPLAWREVTETVEYLEDNSGPELARRFIDALIRSAERLSSMPLIGAPCGFRRTGTEKIRRWPVQDFANWLIFYFPDGKEGIVIVRVLHGARDLKSIWAAEE